MQQFFRVSLVVFLGSCVVVFSGIRVTDRGFDSDLSAGSVDAQNSYRTPVVSSAVLTLGDDGKLKKFRSSHSLKNGVDKRAKALTFGEVSARLSLR